MRFTPVTVLAGVVSAVMSSLMMTMRTPATMLMISMIVLSSSSETSASTVTAMGNHSRRKQKQLQQQQQQQQHQHSASSQSSSNPSTLSSTKGSSNPHHHRHHHHENCSGSPDVTKHHRRACRFYIWDGPSALLYKWCNHLLKVRLTLTSKQACKQEKKTQLQPGGTGQHNVDARHCTLSVDSSK